MTITLTIAAFAALWAVAWIIACLVTDAAYDRARDRAWTEFKPRPLRVRDEIGEHHGAPSTPARRDPIPGKRRQISGGQA